MKEITQTITVYDYDELSVEAQEKVINDCIEFLLEVDNYEDMSPSMRRAVDKAQQMQTPWFVGSYVWEYAKSEVLDLAKSNQYLENGTLN